MKTDEQTAFRVKVAEATRARLELGKGLFALIDAEDMPRVAAHGAWHAEKSRGQIYAAHSHYIGDGKARRVMLHRLVMNAPPRKMVMHRNGIGLDCTKENLLFGTHQTNGASHRRKQAGTSSRFRGVSQNNGRGKKWKACLTVAGKYVYLGKYDSEVDAARAYNAGALIHYGEHASLNQV